MKAPPPPMQPVGVIFLLSEDQVKMALSQISSVVERGREN